MTRRYSSTAQPTTLSAGCTSSATTIQVTATTGFPAVDFVLALDYGAAGQELVLCTNVAGTTLTVTRGYNSTPAAAHLLGAAVRHVHAAIDFTDSRTHEAASAAVHGLAGTVVGTTDAQALSNKDLSSGTNTFPAALATDAEVSSAVSTHAALTATHGATGAVVGTTNTQALTNKTLDATNTINGFTASRFMEADGTGRLASGSKAVPAGTVVGTSDTQALTNKDLSSSTNTFPARPTIQVFTASGTYTKPAGAKWVRVRLVGGGGGGGGCQSTDASSTWKSGGAGGSGGGYAEAWLAAGALGATVAVTVGAAGGASGAGVFSGGTGGTSSFSTFCAATGGGGGAGGGAASADFGGDLYAVNEAQSLMLSPAVSNPGVGTIGDALFYGEYGSRSRYNAYGLFVGGRGGSSAYGPGADVPNGTNGLTPLGYGGGGSGAMTDQITAQANKSGGAGAPGLVIVETYFV